MSSTTGPPCEQRAGPALVELPQRVADARAAGPVGHRARHAGDRLVQLRARSSVRDARQPGGEEEHFDAPMPRGSAWAKCSSMRE